MATIPEYKAWWAARDRCENLKSAWYHCYGGCGIRMCEAWRADWRMFLADMGARPSRRHTLERRDNDGHYEPGNCYWATWSEQKRNSRSGPKRMDLTGYRFSRLVALYPEPKRPYRMTHWVCRCDCGAVRSVGISGLRSGRTKSCGCYIKEFHTRRLREYWKLHAGSTGSGLKLVG